MARRHEAQIMEAQAEAACARILLHIYCSPLIVCHVRVCAATRLVCFSSQAAASFDETQVRSCSGSHVCKQDSGQSNCT